jgi:hypothetical protein
VLRSIALVALVGCAEHRVTTWRTSLAAASGDLHVRGEATVEAAEEEDDTSYQEKRRRATVHATDKVGVEIDLGQGASQRLELRIDRLLAGCPPTSFDDRGPVDPACLLVRTRGPIVLERSKRANGGIALGIGAGLVFSGAVYCALACEPPWSTASRVTVGAVAVVALVGLGIVYVMSKTGE